MLDYNSLETICVDLYLDYVNNYLSQDKWQEDNNLTDNQVKFIFEQASITLDHVNG